MPIQRFLFPAVLALALSALAFSAGGARAEVPIAGKLKIPNYTLAKLTADVKDGVCAWRVTGYDANGKRIRASVEKAGNRLVFTGPPGTYEVTVTVTRGKVIDGKVVLEQEEGEAVVVIGAAEPDPGPDPGPGPKPPPPDDALTKALKDAYAADGGAEKAKHVAALAALYRQAAALDLSTTKTAGDLYALLKKASSGLYPADALPKTRQAVAEELKKVLPVTTDADLSDTHRTAAKALFARLGEILGGLK